MSVPLFEQANELNQEGKFEEAAKLYDMLLTQNAKNPGLLATMGTLLIRSNETLGLGITLLHAAIDNSKGDVPTEVWSNLGVGYRNSGQFDKAIELLEKAAKKSPNAATLVNYGNCFVEQGSPQKAIEPLRRAMKMAPEEYLAKWNLSLALLELGEWAEGWDLYDAGLQPGGMRADRQLGGRPMWDGTPGKKIIVHGEQGIGDEIMFASMIPDLMKTNEVVFECHPRLVRLFEESFGIKCVGTRKETEVPWVEDEQFDYRLAVGSLGRFFRRKKADFPGTAYLKTTPRPKGDRFRIGISWTGGRFANRVARRTVPLSWWRSIFEGNRTAEFISLQYTEGCEEEIEIANKQFGMEVTQAPEAKAVDYAETASLVASCDLIITVCTSLVHLAGALGVPCWVMVPHKPAWRYGHKGPMPWYRSVRLYRQPEDGEEHWIPVIQRIGLDLNDKLAIPEARAA